MTKITQKPLDKSLLFFKKNSYFECVTKKPQFPLTIYCETPTNIVAGNSIAICIILLKNSSLTPTNVSVSFSLDKETPQIKAVPSFNDSNKQKLSFNHLISANTISQTLDLECNYTIEGDTHTLVSNIILHCRLLNQPEKINIIGKQENNKGSKGNASADEIHLNVYPSQFDNNDLSINSVELDFHHLRKPLSIMKKIKPSICISCILAFILAVGTAVFNFLPKIHSTEKKKENPIPPVININPVISPVFNPKFRQSNENTDRSSNEIPNNKNNLDEKDFEEAKIQYRIAKSTQSIKKFQNFIKTYKHHNNKKILFLVGNVTRAIAILETPQHHPKNLQKRELTAKQKDKIREETEHEHQEILRKIQPK